MATNPRGTSLVEVLMAVIIFGICVGIFYSVFYLNWQAFDRYIAKADFSQELDRIVDSIALDARFAQRIEVPATAAGEDKTATMMAPDGTAVATYSMMNDGRMMLSRQGVVSLLTDKLDFPVSDFDQDGNAVTVKVGLIDQLFGRTVTLDAATEIYPRNN